MQGDIQQLVQAIESLQSNTFKDYILPVGSVLLSGALGAGVAYYSVDRQETTKIEIEKINIVNETFLMIAEMQEFLIGIKSGYMGELTDDPIQRLLAVPLHILDDKLFDIELSRLSFIVPAQNKIKHNCLRLEFIGALFHNYKTVINFWKIWNDRKTDLYSKLSIESEITISTVELINKAGYEKVKQCSEVLEAVLILTDDLIIEFTCFLISFSDLAKKKINKRVMKKYGFLLSAAKSNNRSLFEFITRMPEVNYVQMTKLHNKNEDYIRRRYSSSYLDVA
ncbi:hypothetical protein [Aliivibrio sifiae]|uniref:hypothetical protein n=1 Tax=Aliivibrio sifiae TaxID=566293 RepID=UPI003D0DBE53